MDSTLIQGEVIDELAREKGVFDEVAAITHEAMNGRMDFNESLRQRVGKLKGLNQANLDQVLSRIELTAGAEDLIGVLKKLGYKIALISGGFTFVAHPLKVRLGLDHVYANQLEVQNGTLTGKTIPPIVNAQRKADLLDEIARKENIALDQVIAIGDGANDLLMLEKAGLGIAFNAKKSVREKADLSISQKNLRSILYLLGLSEKDLAVCLTPTHQVVAQAKTSDELSVACRGSTSIAAPPRSLFENFWLIIPPTETVRGYPVVAKYVDS